MRRTLLACLLLFLGVLSVAAQQTVFGTVLDEAGEPVIGGNVAVYEGESFATGSQTDFDGNFSISLDPGTYNIEFSYVGYAPRRINGFTVLVGQENKLDMAFEDAGVTLEQAVVVDYKVDPMKVDETSQGITLTSEDVAQLGTRSINAIASLSAGASSADEGSAISIRGGRTDATQYVIDGVRVTGALIPETEIDQIQVITGGVEAKYGDLSGGVISITTKGPSSEFNGYVEGETSSFLDPYNNNLTGLSLSGPILKRALTDGRQQTVLGYRVSGRYTYQEDDDPPASAIYAITDEARERLEENPITRIGNSGFEPSAAFLTDEDVEVLDSQPFDAFERIDITAKLDAQLTDAIDVTLSGTYNNQYDQFNPGPGAVPLLNAHNNPFSDADTYRGNFRFRQRLGRQDIASSDSTSGFVSNAIYTLQAGWQRSVDNLEDPRHGSNFFDYGYIGKFDFDNVAIYDTTVQFDPTTQEPILDVNHIGYRETFRSYVPGTQNPVLAAYNKLGLENPEPGQELDFIALNGALANVIDNGVYGLHTSIGQIYNRYSKSKDDLINFNLGFQFDLTPGGSRNGRHNIQVGLAYEQRIERSYVLLPRNLWTIAGNLANAPIQGLDSSRVASTDVFEFDFPNLGTIRDTVDTFAPRLDPEAVTTDTRFFYKIRESLGLSELDYVNVNELDPSQLSLDMFSASELSSLNNLGYAGYDYLGNEVGNEFAWEDFFTARNAEGQRTFPVAPIQPIYASFYLQDKFNFRNIIVRAGVRVDYYDANTKVLKDPYELYDIQTAGDFAYVDGDTRPENIPDEAKVYIESADNRRVKAYRVEDTWFTANGRQVNRAAEIFEGSQVPAFVDERAQEDANYIRAEDFDPDASFTDYEAQINVMPRLAFSFPISDKANFFAHYDVLVQRPPSNTVATALNYFYWFDNLSNVQNNPNLRPSRTIDYEAGFQQRISAASALKVSFFVREMRDMIQRRTYLFAMGERNSYTTYDNQDFGTVKGLNVSYDLRRTGPLSLRLSYALQFADGTGSDANSQQGSVNRGNLRTLYPLNYDERHRLSGAIDFRYGNGDGPVIAGITPFANTGINLFGSAVSGRPYTRLQTPTQLGGRGNEGDINGSRLPWNLVVNLRVDRDVTLFNENGNGINFNVYLRVSNLLSRRNIINVYPATGQPDDDGFLASPIGQQVIGAQIDPAAFQRSYRWRLLNPNQYSLPRRLFLGASFSF